MLASATLLQLEGLITQCRLLMKETVNLQTVLAYYEAACTYGTTDVEKVTTTRSRRDIPVSIPVSLTQNAHLTTKTEI